MAFLEKAKTDNERRTKEIMNTTDVYFKNKFEGKLAFPEGELAIGLEPGTVAPYDMLMGALAGCLYSTFLDVVEKKRGSFEKAEFHIEWEKRTAVPTTLKWVRVKLTILGADEKDKPGMEKAAKLAAKHCSIYSTISFVADMSMEVIFA